MGARLSNQQLTGTDVAGWQSQAGVDEPTIRTALADAATTTGKEWFKREDRGEELAGIVIAHWDGLAGTHLVKVIGELQKFAYPRTTEELPTGEVEQAVHG